MNESSSDPLVSICIPSYRGAAYLPATIDSVLRQSYSRFELWIVDDASPDDTADTVTRYQDPRIKLARNATNLGPEGNWNRCLRLATGKYYQLLPQDDLLEPEALEEHVAILEADAEGEIALVFGSRLVIDDIGRKIVRRDLGLSGPRRIAGRQLVRRCVRAGTNVIGEPGNALMRRSLASQLGDYDASFPYMVDLDYWFRALAFGDAYYTGKRSSCFRVSKGSWSVAIGRKQLSDFVGFVEKYADDPAIGITPADLAIGFVKARANTVGRALLYRLIFDLRPAKTRKPSTFGDDYAASQIARRSSAWRRRVRQLYLDRILAFVDGPTVDIGCGAGQLLEQLPPGSIGLEISPILVNYQRAKGLNAVQVTPEADRIVLGGLRPGTVRTAVLSHVLEHFERAATVLRRLIDECRTLGISRLIVVVPGRVGYESDATHRTFVTRDYLRNNDLWDEPEFGVIACTYFPGNIAAVGEWFVYHEMLVVYDLAPSTTRVRANIGDARNRSQFARFVAVGLVNTAFSYAIYAALVAVGLSYLLANFTALLAGILFSFKTQGALVFGNSDNGRLLRFSAAWAVIYLFGIFVISRFIALGFDSYASGALAIPFTTVLSYFAQKYFVFRVKAVPPLVKKKE